MDKMDENQELISALADGQLRGDAFARGVQLAASPEGRQAWHAYHVVGEVLRTGRPCAGSAPDAFLERLQERLRAEALPVAAPQPELTVLATDRAAANDWLWKLVAGVASVAAVSAVGWNMFGSLGSGNAAPQLAAAPAQVVPVATADPRATAMIRDPRLDQLLAAHRQLGGATALQQSSGFLRNATFEGPAR